MNNIRTITRNLTIRYAFVQGFFWIAFCAISGYAAIFLEWKQYNTAQIGLILSLGSLCSVLLQPVIAAFADKTTKISVKNITVLVLLLNLLFGILLYLLPVSFYLTAVLYIMIQAILFSLPPLLNSMALEYMNQGILINYGLARGIGSVSFAIMSYFLGFMIKNKGASVLLPFFLAFSALLAFSAFTFQLSQSQMSGIDSLSSINKPGAEKKKSNLTLFSFLLHYKRFSIQLTGIILLFTCHNMLNTYLINIVEHVGGNSTHFGISLALAAALELPTMTVFVYLVKKIKCGMLLKAAAFFFIIKSALLIFAGTVTGVYISQAFQMISYALFTPALVDYVNKIMPQQDKVKGQAFAGVATMGVSGILGSFLAGQIINHAGVPAMLVVSTLISGMGFLILLFSTENIA